MPPVHLLLSAYLTKGLDLCSAGVPSQQTSIAVLIGLQLVRWALVGWRHFLIDLFFQHRIFRQD